MGIFNQMSYSACILVKDAQMFMKSFLIVDILEIWFSLSQVKIDLVKILT